MSQQQNNSALIAGMAQAISAGAGAYMSGQNVDASYHATKKLNQQQWQRDLEMWDWTNEYNSPRRQMQRLKEAGLNPNLVYGSGGVGSGNTAASAPRAPSQTVDFSSRQSPLEGLASVISAYQDTRMKSAQIDQVQAMADNAKARTINELERKIQVTAMGQSARIKAQYDKDFLEKYSQSLAQHSFQKSIQSVQKGRRELSLMDQRAVTENMRQNVMGSQKQSIDKDIENKNADILFKQYRNQFMKMGVTTSDNIVIRFLAKMLTEAGISPF